MARPFTFAHVSDFHVSTFGDTVHDRLGRRRRSARQADVSDARWETVWSEAGWRVLHARGARPGRLALVDPEGYAHPIPTERAEGAGASIDPVERAAARACRLEGRRAVTLAAALPTPGALDVLLEATPTNTNLRLIRAATLVDQSDVDMVLATGDLTEDGDGYELVEAVFRRFLEAGRFAAIPGNHDLYLMPFSGTARPKPTHASKRARWNEFAKGLRLDVSTSGAWVRHIPEGDAVLVGLDSCARPQRRFFRHNGAVGPTQLGFLRELAKTDAWRRARHRLVAIHHHVVSLPMGVGRRSPLELGMRLDDAKEAAEVFDACGVTLVMHGHRHISEERMPAKSNFRILASPSLTLGCLSGDGPSFWRVELGDRVHAERVRIPMGAVPTADEDDDAGASESDGDDMLLDE